MTSKDTKSENWPSEINKDFAYKDNWEKEIAVFEMSRSGAHAFMYWMIKQLEEEFGVFFVNNIAWLPGKMKGSNLLYGDMSKLNSAQRDETLYDKQNFLSSAKKTLVYEVEDALNPSIPMLNDNLINIHRKKVGPSKEEFNILFLRDPFNLLASLIRKAEQLKLVYWKTDFGYLCDKNYMLFSDLWKLYAKEFLGETNLLEVCGRKKVCISYNRWFLDKEYRRSIAKEIGFVFTDEGIN